MNCKLSHTYSLFIIRPVMMILLALAMLISVALAGPKDSQAQAGLPACPAAFVMDAAVDHHGSLWVASEGQGIWRLPRGGSWEQMNSAPGFPADSLNMYALAVDREGRVWAGAAHEGVAVWNGQSWKTYNRLNGLAGERVFAICANPASGDVAVATLGGLSVYSAGDRAWATVTRAEGLAEN